MDSIEFYKYSEKVEKELLKKINFQIELSRSSYKNEFKKKARKSNFNMNNFIMNNEVFDSVTKNLFNTIDELNVLSFKNIGEYYYKEALKEVSKFLDKEIDEVIDKAYTDEVLDTILAGFILGNGLNYTYDQELDRRSDYFNTQMGNSVMAIINNRISTLTQKDIQKQYSKVISDGFNINDEIINATMKAQKRGISRFVDVMTVFVAVESTRKAFVDNGIKQVIRHAEVDDRTCDYCLERDGKIYESEEHVDIPSHTACRCWIEPYSEEEN